MKSWFEAWIEALRLLQLAWVAAFSLLIPLLVGIWLDRRYDCTPWLTLAGMIVGTMAAVHAVVREVSRSYRLSAGNKHKNDRKEDETECQST